MPGGDSLSGSFAGDGALALAQHTSPLLAHSFVGTPHNQAPEIVACCSYSSKADIWALGCVLHELATLQPAFKVTAAH